MNRLSLAPTVSVIIPVYNAEPWLAETIESVLGQTCPPQQVIVVDDGSTDQSAAVARRYARYIQLVAQPNAGCAHARNHGVALAQGELLAFLDADDGWLPERLALQLAALAEAPTLEAVFGQIEQRCAPDLAEQPVAFAAQVQDGCTLNTLLIRRRAFQRIGAFDPALHLINAIEWLWRARRMGLQSEILPQVVAWRRIHGENMSIRERPRVHAEYFRLIRQMRQPVSTCGLPCAPTIEKSS